MNKKLKLELNESLDKALEPPKKKKQQNLDSLLEQYQDESATQRQITHITPSSSAIITTSSSPTGTPSNSPVLQLFESPAPARDFHKVANSINRDGLPQGLFERPSMKVVYDVLYQLTRGAITPSRTIRITKDQLQKKCGLGSRVTLDSAVVDLVGVGLVRVEVVGGKQGGNVYETFLPEELQYYGNTPTSTSNRDTSTPTRGASPRQNLEPLVPPETAPSSTRLKAINKDVSDASNTFYKTKDKSSDDEQNASLKIFIEKINRVFKEISGKEVEISDAESMGELADLIAEELRAARLNTKSISKPAAFLVAHLRTRLSRPERGVKLTGAKVKPDTVGKAEAKPIDLSKYTAEELKEFEKEFCLTCGRAHDECECQKNGVR